MISISGLPAFLLYVVTAGGLIGLYLRLKLDETPAFQALEADHEVSHSPLGETLRLSPLAGLPLARNDMPSNAMAWPLL